MKQINRDSREIENIMKLKIKNQIPLNQDIDHLQSFHFPESKTTKNQRGNQKRKISKIPTNICSNTPIPIDISQYNDNIYNTYKI